MYKRIFEDKHNQKKLTIKKKESHRLFSGGGKINKDHRSEANELKNTKALKQILRSARGYVLIFTILPFWQFHLYYEKYCFGHM